MPLFPDAGTRAIYYLMNHRSFIRLDDQNDQNDQISEAGSQWQGVCSAISSPKPICPAPERPGSVSEPSDRLEALHRPSLSDEVANLTVAGP